MEGTPLHIIESPFMKLAQFCKLIKEYEMGFAISNQVREKLTLLQRLPSTVQQFHEYGVQRILFIECTHIAAHYYLETNQFCKLYLLSLSCCFVSTLIWQRESDINACLSLSSKELSQEREKTLELIGLVQQTLNQRPNPLNFQSFQGVTFSGKFYGPDLQNILDLLVYFTLISIPGEDELSASASPELINEQCWARVKWMEMGYAKKEWLSRMAYQANYVGTEHLPDHSCVTIVSLVSEKQWNAMSTLKEYVGREEYNKSFVNQFYFRPTVAQVSLGCHMLHYFKSMLSEKRRDQIFKKFEDNLGAILSQSDYPHDNLPKDSTSQIFQAFYKNAKTVTPDSVTKWKKHNEEFFRGYLQMPCFPLIY